MVNSINKFELFRFYKIESFAAETLRVLMSQLLETYIDAGNCTVLVTLDKKQFDNLAQAYRDICTGYKHPRSNSLSASFRANDATLKKLASIFPHWNAVMPGATCA